MLNSVGTGQILSLICKKNDLYIRCLSMKARSSGPSALNPKAFDAKRSARMFKKIMVGTKHTSRKTAQHHPSKHLTDFGFMKNSSAPSSHRPVSGKLLRRMDMLNNLFVEQITSLLGTGEVAPEFLGLGIQISKVKVSSDFSAVNVYWYASGTEKDEEIAKVLASNAGHLRHELTQLRVIGLVPPINFHSDKTFSKLQEVEMLLSKCGVALTTESAVNREVSAAGEDKSEPEVVAEDKDAMSHDILELRHDRIMDKVRKALDKKMERKRAKEEQRQSNLMAAAITAEYSDTESVTDHNNSTDTEEELSPLQQHVENHRKRQSEFLKYLKQQQAEKAKELKRVSMEAKEKEFFLQEREDRRRKQLFMRLDELDDTAEGSDDEEEEVDKFIEQQETYYKNFRDGFK